MSIITRLSNAWKALTSPDDASRLLSQEAAPIKERQEVAPTDAIGRFWVNDEQLRALAQDSKDKTTHWVIAGDFEELFQWIDQFNQGKNDNLQMKLEVSNFFHDDLKKLRDERLHDDGVDALARGKETIVITGSNVQKVFGPTFISDEDMRLNIGGIEILAYYKGSMMDNTSINFLIDGQWQTIEFGMGHVPEFFGGRKQEMVGQDINPLTLER